MKTIILLLLMINANAGDDIYSKCEGLMTTSKDLIVISDNLNTIAADNRECIEILHISFDSEDQAVILK